MKLYTNDEERVLLLAFDYSEKELVLSILNAITPTNQGGKEALEQYKSQVIFAGEENGTMQ